MPASAPAFRIAAIDLYERPLRYRMPFRFGAATVSEGVQVFVRARIALDDGREAMGGAAELMVPKWFDKNPALSNDDNIEQLRRALDMARVAYLAPRQSRTAFGHYAAHLDECREEGERQGLPTLVAGFGPAEIDKAVLDALCRALGISFYEAVRRNAVGFDPAIVASDTAGVDPSAFLAALEPRATIAVRHTIGIADPLRSHCARIDDGLPESLVEVIDRYGIRWFKVKLGGDVASDVARLREVAAVLDTLPEYGVTLDGNEQFGVPTLRELLRELRESAALARFSRAIAFVEQPLPRRLTFDVDLHGQDEGFPMLIDEADATLDAFPRARSLGYKGVSSKSCKGLYKSLVNTLRCAIWNAASCTSEFFVSAEDLTTPAGLALQQDLALASLLGIAHVERNGHHYIDGMASAPPSEQRTFLERHSDLYEASHGAVRLKIRDGALAIGSLACTGFASGALPDWSALAPLGTAAQRASSGSAAPHAPRARQPEPREH